MRKIGWWSIKIIKVVCGLLRSPRVIIFLYFELCYPFCVEVIVKEFGFVGIPLSVEVIVVGLALCLSL